VLAERDGIGLPDAVSCRSALSGAAWNAGSLIVFRVIEGAGAGLMMPIITALLAQAAGWWAG